eukprot:3513783-Rhodomonas_salina.3
MLRPGLAYAAARVPSNPGADFPDAVLAAFAVFGMAIFQNSFRRRCIAQDRQVPVRSLAMLMLSGLHRSV